MKNVFKAAALGLVALGLSVNASAVPVSFESSVPQWVYLEEGESKTYWHNLVDEGFVVGSHVAQSFNLWIKLHDPFDWFRPETVAINIAAGSPEAEYGSFLNLVLPDFGVFGSTMAQALLQITDTGLLSITVASVRGDFYLGDSYLKVNATAVPEPGMLALLLAGAAIAGFAITRRRRPLGAKVG